MWNFQWFSTEKPLHKGQTDETIRPYVVCTHPFNFISYHFLLFSFPPSHSCSCPGAFAALMFPSPSFYPYSSFRQESNPQGSHRQPSLAKAFFLSYHSNTNTSAWLCYNCSAIPTCLIIWLVTVWSNGTNAPGREEPRLKEHPPSLAHPAPDLR